MARTRFRTYNLYFNPYSRHFLKQESIEDDFLQLLEIYIGIFGFQKILEDKLLEFSP